MAYFEWEGRYELGVAAMDAEHRALVDLMSKLHERNLAGAPPWELKAILGDLEALTKKHFADEEACMASRGFAGLATHKLIHADLLAKFGALAAEYAATGGRVPEALFGFLRLWLSAHIQGIDRKYAPARASVA
jgi:hemerythrin-like metal-binding protein